MKLPIYLDNNATTMVDPRVLEAMLPFFQDCFGNAASSHHFFGATARNAVEAARGYIAELIGAHPQEIIFTSGATEANNLALKGAAEAQPDKRHIISSPTEHPAVLECLKRFARIGYEITLLPVDGCGVVDLNALERSLRSDTLLVSVMAANNEIGTVAPIAEIGALTRASGVLFHCDAAQMAGKLPIDVEEMNIDLLSLSAHKMYGPKGVGALYVRRRPEARLEPILDGGGHERGLRSGTLNVPGCVGLGEAARIACLEMGEEARRLLELREQLLQRITSSLEEVYLNGHPIQRLPGNLNLCFRGVDADALMLVVSDVAVSSGSACSAASPAPSHVLLGIGLSYEEAQQSIRFGIGRFNTKEEIEYAAGRMVEGVRLLRSMASVQGGMTA